MRNAVWVVAVLLVAALVAGCGGRSAQQPQPQPQQPTGAASPAAPAGAREIKIVGKDNLYEPATITIKAGQEYEIDFDNEGTTVHNLIIQSKDQVGQDFASDIAVNAGQDSKFKVKIDKPGTYKMTCTYHPEMVGELKVEP